MNQKEINEMSVENYQQVDGLVSVVIPAYNHEKYVGRTLSSIIGQTYAKIELIIVDDGSKDGTASEIEKLRKQCEERFESFKFVTKLNEGIVKTLNLGLSLAQGEFVYFIASDDFAHPDAISTLYSHLEDDPSYGLAVGDNFIVDDSNNRKFWDQNRNLIPVNSLDGFRTFMEFIRKSNPYLQDELENFGDYKTLLKGGNHVVNGYLIRRALIDEVGGYRDDAPLEDYFLMLQLSKITKFKFVNQPLFYYRWHDSNTVKQIEKMTRIQLLTIAKEKSLNHGSPAEVRRSLFREFGAFEYRCGRLGLLKLISAKDNVLSFVDYLWYRVHGLRKKLGI